MGSDDAALLEQVPSFVPAGLRPVVKPVALLAVAHLQRITKLEVYRGLGAADVWFWRGRGRPV
jgi:hypothetical protein